ncbi:MULTISPECIES: glycosyltransferase [unclassified Marinobacter]|uniref:glycosyltransferase n=1 Tax=unclassified Marinobacter TaxID=83889 RepID=UPI003008F630
MLELLFWVALLGSVYSYFLYPIVLKLTPRRGSSERKLNAQPPRVSLIVTAHNEEERIRDKILNCLELSYPQLEVVVASDASVDETDAIVRSFKNDGVKLARAEERKGKENAQLHAIRAAEGDILVFSDVATRIPPDAIEKLVSHFEDTAVGAVSSEDRFISRDGLVAGEGAYVKYEMLLRRLESQRAGLVGLSGSFFAARKEVCEAWDILSPSDFNTALNCATLGYVAITAPDVLGYYQDVQDPGKEYQRKLRTVIRGLTAAARHKEALNPFKFRWFAFQLWSHKILRWAVPWFLVLLAICTLLLAYRGGIYSLAMLCQLAFYAIVVFGYFSSSHRDKTVVKIPYFFVQVNVAIAHATLRFLRGERMTVWSPSKR